MTFPSHPLPPLSRLWMLTGVWALAFSGLLAVLLVLSRALPAAYVPWNDFFYTALVVHVDLSVLVWFLAAAAMLWSLNLKPLTPFAQMAARAAWLSFTAGTLILALCPFLGIGPALLNNYIPVLEHPLFFFGLSLIFCGILLQAILSLVCGNTGLNGILLHPLSFAIYSSAAVALISLTGFLLTGWQLPPERGEAYFEDLFWGGGHLLQFLHAQLWTVALLLLARSCLRLPSLPAQLLTACFALHTALALYGLVHGYIWHPGTPEHREFFTQHMRWGSITALLPIGLWLIWHGLRAAPLPGAKPLRAFFFASLLLGAAGGALGWRIDAINLIIPAHYHGSIVGITLAYMGLTVWLLPQWNDRPPGAKLALAIPLIYAAGQLLHITALAWLGSYGIERKTPGAISTFPYADLANGLMKFGGLLAIIGGFCFFILVMRSIRRRRS